VGRLVDIEGGSLLWDGGGWWWQAVDKVVQLVVHFYLDARFEQNIGKTAN
jgi:hypothetical protein